MTERNKKWIPIGVMVFSCVLIILAQFFSDYQRRSQNVISPTRARLSLLSYKAIKVVHGALTLNSALQVVDLKTGQTKIRFRGFKDVLNLKTTFEDRFVAFDGKRFVFYQHFKPFLIQPGSYSHFDFDTSGKHFAYQKSQNELVMVSMWNFPEVKFYKYKLKFNLWGFGFDGLGSDLYLQDKTGRLHFLWDQDIRVFLRKLESNSFLCSGMTCYFLRHRDSYRDLCRYASGASLRPECNLFRTYGRTFFLRNNTSGLLLDVKDNGIKVVFLGYVLREAVLKIDLPIVTAAVSPDNKWLILVTKAELLVFKVRFGNKKTLFQVFRRQKTNQRRVITAVGFVGQTNDLLVSTKSKR